MNFLTNLFKSKNKWISENFMIKVWSFNPFQWYLSGISISFLDKLDFKLSYFVGYLPELFIDADQINTMKIGNYGLNKSNNKYQSCLFSIKDPFFVYKFDKDNTVYRVHDYDSWIWCKNMIHDYDEWIYFMIYFMNIV